MLTVGLGTVGHHTALVVPPLDGTLEALADGGSGHVDQVSLLEHLRHLQGVTGLVGRHLAGVHQPPLAQVPHGGHAGLLQVSQLGLLDLTLRNNLVASLDCAVSISLLGLHLGHNVALLQSNNSGGDAQAISSEVGHHACLGAEQANTSSTGTGLDHQTTAVGTWPHSSHRCGAEWDERRPEGPFRGGESLLHCCGHGYRSTTQSLFVTLGRADCPYLP
mmetsp:Transcript_23362/g.51279  ORF Transcript_23362/g.51279 Transcript_23362/m.51279 type:complete len:219 (+) Transcript_23362:808-1464(+)